MRVESTDRVRLSLLRRGDEQLFANLVRQHTAELLAIARCFANDDDEAADLVQETWARVFLRRNQFRGDGSLRGWVRRVCRTICVSHARQAARRAHLLRLAPTDALLSEADGMADAPMAGSLTAALRRAWPHLTARQRSVCVWRTAGDLTTAEIARRLGMPEGTVKSDLWHSRRRLRQACV